MSRGDLLRCDSDSSLAQQSCGVATLFGQHESDNFAFLAGTSCAARAVQVRLVFHGWVNVNDKFNVVNVHTASGNVCCDQYANRTVGESREVAITSGLRQVAVKVNRRDARVG